MTKSRVSAWRSVRVALVCMSVTSEASADHPPAAGVTQVSAPSGHAARVESAVGTTLLYERINTEASRGAVLSLEKFGQYAVAPHFTLGLAAPVVHVRPHRGAHETGIGRIGIETKIAYETANSGTASHLAWQLRLPTQTVQLGLDPGATSSISVTSVHIFRLQKAGLVLAGTGSAEHRPAGIALDVGGSGWLGYSLGRFTWSAGFHFAIRAATWCRPPRAALQWCTDGRASEVNGEWGTTTVAASLRLDVEVSPRVHAGGSGRVPLSRARSSDLALDVGAIVTF